ncbi:MAG: hypoxanthine phosphoribosyltransferase [Deltaproteobacteria bacterium]|nr:hypoxanthine phosphoribosyltransferase [Deltaproteobacteria bacterium]
MAPTVTTLINAESIASRVHDLGAQITRDYRGKEVNLVAVLNGSYVFVADLARAIDLPVTIDFLGLSSYGGRTTETSGIVQITKDLSRPVEDQEVLIVEDIVDTGLTMAYLFDNLRTRRPRSLRLAALLHKPARQRVAVAIDYLGFTIEDKFVVGYGLDYDDRYRNLPFIGVLDGAGSE